MHTPERKRILSTACNVLARALPEAWAIYAYGSFARGDERPDSDLDLAVLLPHGKRLPDKLTLISEVSQQVGRDVDIVNLREASLDLVRELLKQGEPLLVRRASDVLLWEAEKMTDYAQFNPRRSEILAMYLREPLHTSP